MAIKVKHDVNVAPAAAASMAGGRGRRQVETARFVNPQKTTLTQGAHASPASTGSAQTHIMSAPAPAVQAHAPGLRDSIEERMRLQDNEAALRERAAAIDRNFRSEEADAGREFRTDESSLQRDFQERMDAARRDAAQKEWDRQHGIVRNEREQALVDAGTHEWGYTPEQQKEIAKIQSDFDAAVANGNMSDAEREQARRALEEKINSLPKHAVRRTDAEAMFRENTFTDEQGRVFTRDGKLVCNPLDAEAKRAEFDLKRQDAEEKRYMDAVMKLQQGYRTSQEVKSDFGEVTGYKDVIVPYTDEQREEILRRLFPGKFANVQPAAQTPAASTPPPGQTPAAPPQAPTETPTEAPPPTAPADEKKRYAVSRWGVK